MATLRVFVGLYWECVLLVVTCVTWHLRTNKTLLNTYSIVLDKEDSVLFVTKIDLWRHLEDKHL